MKLKQFFAALAIAAAMPALAQTHAEGVEYYKADQINNARELLTRNFNNPGTDKAISDYYLGLIALTNKDQKEAAKYFAAGVQENPAYGFNYIGQGELALLAGDVKGAEKLFKQGEGLTKKDPAMSVAIARAYYNADPVKYAQQIEKALTKARKFNINAPEIYIFEGDRKADKKDWGGAGADYDMAASFNPTATEAYVKYADLFTQTNPRYAIQMLQNLLKNVPNSALGQRELAMAYYNNEDFAKAADEYGKYVQNPSHFKQDEDRYAFLLFYGGDYKKGYDYATQLLNANPDHFTARRYQFMNAAQIKELNDQLLPMAEKLYAVHLQNPEKNSFAPIDFNLIADEFNRGGKADEAIAVYQEGINELPDNANLVKQLALVYAGKDDMQNAAQTFDKYLSKLEEPGYNDLIQAALLNFAAGVYSTDDAAKADFFANAVNDADKASTILPDNYKPFKIKGDVAIQAAAADAKGSAAFENYKKAAELVAGKEDKYLSDSKAIYNYLCNYYLDQKDVPEAKAWGLKVVELDPNNTQYRDFVNGLK